MAASTFVKVMPHVFEIEKGYVDHPKDPGGATNMGITQKTLAAWRGKPVTKADVKALTQAEARDIYQANFWNVIRGDDLPAGVDYAVFDFAINSGPSRAAKFLQRIVGVSKVDGVIGSITLEATRVHNPAAVVRDLCDNRLAWLKTLAGWKTFGKGWERRVSGVREVALELAVAAPVGPTPEWRKEGLWAFLWRILTTIWKGRRK